MTLAICNFSISIRAFHKRYHALMSVFFLDFYLGCVFVRDGLNS